MGITRFPPSIVAKLSDLTDVDVTQSLTYPIGNGTFLVFDAVTQTWKVIADPGKFFAQLVGKLFYRDASNGVTIKALDAASVGDTDTIDGKTFTLVDSDPGDANAGTSVTTGVTSMANWFSNYSDAEAPDVKTWDTSNVTNMQSTFSSSNAANPNLDVSYWDTSNVEDMSFLFYQSQFPRPSAGLQNWDTSSVTTFDATFRQAEKVGGDLSAWNVSNATTFREMFYSVLSPEAALNVSGWNMSSLGTFSNQVLGYMFFGYPGDVDASNWSIQIHPTGVSLEGLAVASSGSFNLDNWVFSGTTNTYAQIYFGSFGNGSSASFSMLNWDFTGVVAGAGNTLMVDFVDAEFPSGTTLSGWTFDKPAGELGTREIYYGGAYSCLASDFNGPINDLSFKNCDVVHVSSLFNGNNNFNSSLNNWDFSNAGEVVMDGTFRFAGTFNQPLDTWNFDGAQNVRATSTFQNATSFNQDISMWDFSGFTFLNNFLDGATSFSTANYDALLNRWADQVQNDGMATNLTTTVSATYSSAGAASRTYLINQGWSITDEGQV